MYNLMRSLSPCLDGRRADWAAWPLAACWLQNVLWLTRASLLHHLQASGTLTGVKAQQASSDTAKESRKR